ncbi:MAG TPA: M28 family metallopeptidase [Vicinamibacteria bacterium]
MKHSMVARRASRWLGGLAIGMVVGILSTTHMARSESAPPRGFLSGEWPTGLDWENRYRSLPLAENIREYMRVISEEPHHAGGPGSRRVAEYVLSQLTAWGLTAWIEEFEALMPVPVERAVELVEPETYTARLEEPPLVEDKDSSDENQLPTFSAYAADGDVTAPLVYVNYGGPRDYQKLREMGVDVRGKIVIARYGQTWRGIKAKLAAEHGAVACLLYSDPEDDGYRQGDVYPDGPFRPWHGVQRGSVIDMPVHPGDPLTPGWAAERGAPRLDRTEAKTLVSIPVQPLSYADAMPLLENLRGTVAPREWQGALPMTYHVGPGPARVRVKLAFDWKTRPIYNVLARIEGRVFPNQWILYGNHHDSWVNGAADPTSGTAALLETARSLAKLVDEGWRPKRTIVLASWDGEEWGLMGSTEWAEKHAAELTEKAVAYINTDTSGKGWISMSGTHSLQALANEVTKDILDPRSGKSLREEARERRIEQARNSDEREKIELQETLSIGALGSGSDYTPFLNHLAIASLHFAFTDESSAGVYHSTYDSFHWYTHFSDSTFEYGATLSRVTGTTLLRLADATLLPFDFTDYASVLARYVDEIEETSKEMGHASPPDLSPVRAAITAFHEASESYEEKLGRFAGAEPSSIEARWDEIAELNRLLYTTERLLGHERGLPDREWYRHQIYAPGYYTGYGVKTLPGIRESVEQGATDRIQPYVAIVSASIHDLARRVDDAQKLLASILE